MSPEAHQRNARRSQCDGKRRYRDHDEAVRLRQRRETEAGHALRIYDCPFCNGFHLTKQAARA